MNVESHNTSNMNTSIIIRSTTSIGLSADVIIRAQLVSVFELC